MAQKVAYFPLGGGLDLTTPAIATKPGTARAALNYESDISGYRRIGGYERFDGQTSPTDAFNAAVDVTAGAIARDAARTAILAVPGSGQIRGVWYYNGTVYAFRDNGGATAGVMYKSSSSGWTAVTFGYKIPYTSGGTYVTKQGDVITGATSAKTATVQRIIITSGTFAGGDAAGYIVVASASGAFTPGENVNVGANLNTLTLTTDKVAITLPPGGAYEFVNYNFGGNDGTLRMYGVNGVGTGFEFDGTVFCPISVPGMVSDVPFKVAAHKKHLFFAYPGGSAQHSSIGDPLTWNAIQGAAEIAVGDEITGFVSAAPTNLFILAKNSVNALYGSDTSDWQLQTLTDEAGALAGSPQKMGSVIYMDNRGIRSVSTTASYGDFELGTMTRTSSPLIHSRLTAGQTPIASVRIRSRDTYRVFFADGTGISVYIGKKNPETMPIDLAIPVTCACSAETTNAVEKSWFGSTNGFVYQMDKGRSYDGAALSYHLRMPFNHHNMPHTIKRWHRAAVEYNALGNATLTIAGEVDYADPSEPPIVEQSIGMFGGGGFWDAVNWDQFYWSAPVEGKSKVYIDAVGESMSLLLGGSASDEEPHTIEGITLFYTVRGISR